MMLFGLVAISGCAFYLYQMNANSDTKGKETYTALGSNDELVVKVKRSKWD